jgi:adenylosuccinate synthase
MSKVILISGHICSGKSNLAGNLCTRFGFESVKTSDVVRDIAVQNGMPTDRESLQNLGDRLDVETEGRWVLDAVRRLLSSKPSANVVVDAVRISAQVERFREQFGPQVTHVHLWASEPTLHRRFESRKARGRETDASMTYARANLNKTEKEVDYLEREADLSVNTERSDVQDTFTRVAARMGLYADVAAPAVDVVVGGQYGSEGKGQIAAYLAREYDVLVRVGGPNAGHSVRSLSGKYVYHHLPSGSRDSEGLILIGPGAVINPEGILKEIQECGLVPGRIFIDPQAMVISPQDILEEQKTVVGAISSTGTGTGHALARKVLHRGKRNQIVAKDYPELKPFLGETFEHLERAFAAGKRVLLEGTQGSGLSLHHGSYPHVTSRDTNVAGCLAEAGIAPGRVGHVIMVVRTYPIRVADPEPEQSADSVIRKIGQIVTGSLGRQVEAEPERTSGRLKQEITFAEVARRANLDPQNVESAEITSTTKRRRRVGEFEWDQFRKACALNAPTDLAVTFADYISADNRNARRYEQLTADTIQWIEELERVAHAPASLISTRFSERAIIDRRNWT